MGSSNMRFSTLWLIKRASPELSNCTTEGNMHSSWVSLQEVEQTFFFTLCPQQQRMGINKEQNNQSWVWRSVLCSVTCSVPHLNSFTLDVCNLYYCTRFHCFSIWYCNLKSLFSVLEPGLFVFQMLEFR